MIYLIFPLPVTLDLDFKVILNYTDALDVLFVQLMSDLFAIAKFLFIILSVMIYYILSATLCARWL